MALQLLKTLAALTAVLGLIFLLVWVAKKLRWGRAFGDSTSDGWRILSIKSLGPKRQILLLEVGKRLLVIGATDRSMTSLAEITEDSEREAVLEAVAPKKRGGFHDILRKAQSS
jgi:flagellar biosynthetic protein FliO